MVTFGKLIRVSIKIFKLASQMAGTFFSEESSTDLIGWECQLVELSHFENPPNVVILSKYRFYCRWMAKVPMSVFSNYIRTKDASSWQNKCPEHFSSLASILILIELLYRGVWIDLPPLRYPQPVGAAWDPKSFNDSFDFFAIDPLESLFSYVQGLAKIFLRKVICH